MMFEDYIIQIIDPRIEKDVTKYEIDLKKSKYFKIPNITFLAKLVKSIFTSVYTCLCISTPQAHSNSFKYDFPPSFLFLPKHLRTWHIQTNDKKKINKPINI